MTSGNPHYIPAHPPLPTPTVRSNVGSSFSVCCRNILFGAMAPKTKAAQKAHAKAKAAVERKENAAAALLSGGTPPGQDDAEAAIETEIAASRAAGLATSLALGAPGAVETPAPGAPGAVETSKAVPPGAVGTSEVGAPALDILSDLSPAAKSAGDGDRSPHGERTKKRRHSKGEDNDRDRSRRRRRTHGEARHMFRGWPVVCLKFKTKQMVELRVFASSARLALPLAGGWGT